jgi:hypothetical protein
MQATSNTFSENTYEFSCSTENQMAVFYYRFFVVDEMSFILLPKLSTYFICSNELDKMKICYF